MVDARPLDPRLVSLLSDVQWTAYRLFGVTSQVRAPGLPPEEDAWDWHRPWFCSSLHYDHYDPTEHKSMSPLHFRCERLKARLLARTRRAPAFGRCGSGLRLAALPLRWRGRVLAHLVVGPYSRHSVPESFSRATAEKTGFENPVHLAWCARQIPVLADAEERLMVDWLSVTTTRLLARFAPLQDGAAWETVLGTSWEPCYAPVRLADDLPASIFGVFGWPWENRPFVSPRATSTNFWELLYVEHGRLAIETGGGRFDMVAGQACLFAPGREFSWTPRGNAPRSGIQLTFIGQLGGLLRGLTGRALTLRAGERDDLREICDALFARPESSRESAVRLNLFHILLRLKRGFAMPARDLSLTGPASHERRHSTIDTARRYLEDHASEAVSLDDVARHCATSISTLAHTFKSRTGMSPMHYHLLMKIELARNLLREGAMTVTTIADKLAFSDTAHFSRTFKRMAGISPSAFSRSVRPADKQKTGGSQGRD